MRRKYFESLNQKTIIHWKYRGLAFQSILHKESNKLRGRLNDCAIYSTIHKNAIILLNRFIKLSETCIVMVVTHMQSIQTSIPFTRAHACATPHHYPYMRYLRKSGLLMVTRDCVHVRMV